MSEKQTIELPYSVEDYSYRVFWSEEDGCFIGKVAEFQSLSAHGETEEEALKEIKFVVQASLEWMMEDSEPIPKPLSQTGK